MVKKRVILKDGKKDGRLGGKIEGKNHTKSMVISTRGGRAGGTKEND